MPDGGGRTAGFRKVTEGQAVALVRRVVAAVAGRAGRAGRSGWREGRLSGYRTAAGRGGGYLAEMREIFMIRGPVPNPDRAAAVLSGFATNGWAMFYQTEISYFFIFW